MPGYEKQRIKNALDKYLETEDSKDYGELLMALSPMVWMFVKKYHTLSHHHYDMHQEILMALWKHQSSVNKLKLKRMMKNEFGERYCISNYFWLVIRGYVGIASERFARIFERDIPYRIWFYMEEWMGNLEIDEDTQSFEKRA